MRRIRCTAPGLADLSYRPGQDLMLAVPGRRRVVPSPLHHPVVRPGRPVRRHRRGAARRRAGRRLGRFGPARRAYRGDRPAGQGDRRRRRGLASLRRRRLGRAGQPGHGRVAARSGPCARGPRGRRRRRPAAGVHGRRPGGRRALAAPRRGRSGVEPPTWSPHSRPSTCPPARATPTWPGSSAWWPAMRATLLGARPDGRADLGQALLAGRQGQCRPRRTRAGVGRR